MTREQKLSEIIKNLYLIASDLLPIIIEYEKPVEFDSKPSQIFDLPAGARPRGLISDQQFIYLCDYVHDHIRIYDLTCQVIERNSPYFRYPSGLEIYQKSLYIIDEEKISIFDLQFQLVSSFHIPYTKFGWNHLKLDQNFIYVTISSYNQVFVYTKEGKLKQAIGTADASLKQGEFNDPRGLTVDHNNLYVCDGKNHRIQALFKDNNYSFSRTWGNEGFGNGSFSYPTSICYWDTHLFIGDFYRVQLYTYEGIYLQAIGGGQIGVAGGICVMGERLFVSDTINSRIQIFERITSYETEKEDETPQKKQKKK